MSLPTAVCQAIFTLPISALTRIPGNPMAPAAPFTDTPHSAVLGAIALLHWNLSTKTTILSPTTPRWHFPLFSYPWPLTAFSANLAIEERFSKRFQVPPAIQSFFILLTFLPKSIEVPTPHIPHIPKIIKHRLFKALPSPDHGASLALVVQYLTHTYTVYHGPAPWFAHYPQ